MIQVHCLGPVTRIVLARTLAGWSLHTVSAYLTGEPGRRVLIDSGPPATARELLRWLRESGAAEELAAVVLTHHHEDHAGGAALLAEALGVPVWSPAATAERLARRRRIPLYRAAVWGRPGVCAARPLGEVFEIGGLRLEAVPTPGHAFDHHVLFDRERRWLYSGDLYVHERVRYLRRIEEPWRHVASLRRAAALGPERLYCAHAGVVEDAAAALERKAAWWEELAAEARRLRDGGLGPRAITRRLLGPEGLFTWLSLGDFSKVNLVRALLAGPRGLGWLQGRGAG